MIYDFAVIGGDMRQVYLANYLKNQRYQVITYATKKEGSECKEGKSFENVIREAKCMIGPVVFSKKRGNTGSSSNKKNVSRNTASRNDERTDFIWGMYQ